MTAARRRALIAAAAVLVIAALVAAGLARRHVPARSAGQPDLMVLTSLPLLFGEDFSIPQQDPPALKALEGRYRIVPIDTTAAAGLKKGRLLLMAHPLGQAPEDLVALDLWVRGGGRVLLLADPLLEWPSHRPLGDPLRAPPSFIDTGLLRHWGLRLDAPDQRGPRQMELGGYPIVTASPGALSGRCAISRNRLVAHCRIGKGEATVVADADFLDVADLDGPTGHNLDSLMAELAQLAQA